MPAASNPPPLIERSAALAALHASLERCRGGAGRTVLVRGEASIGKTTLLREWAAQVRAQGGAEIFWGGCEALFDRIGALACADRARRHARKISNVDIKGIKTGP
jgi:predicted ATPase